MRPVNHTFRKLRGSVFLRLNLKGAADETGLGKGVLDRVARGIFPPGFMIDLFTFTPPKGRVLQPAFSLAFLLQPLPSLATLAI